MSASDTTAIKPLPGQGQEQGQVMVPPLSKSMTSWIQSGKARILPGRWTAMGDALRAMECMNEPFPGEPADVTKDERRLLWMDPCSAHHLSVAVNKGRQAAKEQPICFSYIGIGSGLSIALATGVGIFTVAGGCIVFVVGLCLSLLLDIVFIDGRANKINNLTATNWVFRVKSAFFRLKGHVELPIRMEIVRRLLRGDDDRLSTGISVSDKVALMRLSKRMDMIRELPVNKGLVLEGETDELICRVLDALDPEWRNLEEQFMTDKPVFL